MIAAAARIPNRLGLHARAAARFVHLANRYRATITVVGGRSRADGKSILGLLTLAAAQGTQLEILAEGRDGRAAIDALIALVRDGFGEGAA